MRKFSQLLTTTFPNYGVKNIALYYWVKIFSLAFFMIANWLFYALMFVTPAYMGVLESVSFGIGMLLEIPSGAIADLLGKKITVQIGLFMQTIGLGSFLLAPFSPLFIVFGNIVAICGFAMTSGSFEALAYDSMVETKTEQYYDIVASRTGAIFPLVTILSALLGGLMWRYSIYLPWIATTLSFSIAFLLSFKFTEPKVDTYQFSWQQFIDQNRIGLQQLRIPQIKKYFPVMLAILASYYMWSAGIVRIFMGEQFAYDGETLSYLVSAVMFISSISIFYLDKLKKVLGDAKGFVILTAITGIGWIIAGLFSNSLLLGAVVFVFLIITGELAEPWRSTVINKYVESRYRATVISTMQFFIQLPYVAIAMFFGAMIEQNFVQTFYIGVGVVMFASIVWSLAYKVNTQRKLTTQTLTSAQIPTSAAVTTERTHVPPRGD